MREGFAIEFVKLESGTARDAGAIRPRQAEDSLLVAAFSYACLSGQGIRNCYGFRQIWNARRAIDVPTCGLGIAQLG